MKRKASLFISTTLFATAFFVVVFVANQLIELAGHLGSLHPGAGALLIILSSAIISFVLFFGFRFFSLPSKPSLPDDENSKAMAPYLSFMTGRVPIHPRHPEPVKHKKDQRWLRTNLKLLDTDSLNITREIATRNFFVGAFAQNTSYGTTTSLINNLKVVWNIYTLHNREQHLREFIILARSVYEYLPLSDFKKEDIQAHIKPIIQSAFSNTLSSLLPAGNLLAPFFLNLFLAGATNTYLTCLAGIIATRHCQTMTKEDQKEIIQQSTFEASFMLKEIIRECNPILSVTISNAIKKAGLESLDTMQSPSAGSGMAKDIVSHLASSLKSMLKENG
ncbi:MAG: hypothetical protein WCG61_02325 [Chlorobium sp.]